MSSFIDPQYEYHEFYLDSKDATNSISTDISSLNWPVFNLASPLKDVVSFKVLEAQIPLSYSITAGTSFIIRYYPQYTEGTPLPAPLTKTITLPTVGTLSGEQIATYISSQIINFPVNTPGWEKNGAGGQDTFLVCTFESSLSSQTGLPYFKFEPNDHAATSGTLVQQDFEILLSDQRSQDVLGFADGVINKCLEFGKSPATLISQGLPAAYLKSLQSTRPTLITGAPYIYVTSNAIGNACQTYLPLGAKLLGGGVSSPQIAKVPVSNEVMGQWLIWQDSNPAWFDVDTIATLSQMDVFLQLGNYGGYIDFQGLSFSLKLGVLVRRNTFVTSNGRGTFIQSTPRFLMQ